MTDYRAAKSVIALEAHLLSDGTTVTTSCPVCNGGRTGERKLSLTRTYNGAMFCCHRASCGFRGFVSMDGRGGIKDAPRQRIARPYEGVLRPLEDFLQDEFLRKYLGAKPSDFPQLYTDGRGNHVFECRGFNGELLGHVTRTPQKVIKTYRAKDGADIYSVYFPDGSQDMGRLVVVEDCISAMCCASHGYTGLALLGTHMSEQVRKAIVSAAYSDPVVVWLDPDAEHAALKLATTIPGAVARVGGGCDPKDDPWLAATLEALTRGS